MHRQQICIICSQKHEGNFDQNNYEHQCCSNEDPANLQQDMYIIMYLIDDNKITGSQKTFKITLYQLIQI